jgi:hypothetical protein
MPPVPHRSSRVPATHSSPSQQPPHETGSQEQAPATHRSPTPQGAPEPHWHTPATHESERVALQATHTSPGLPQVVTDELSQVVPEQQPPGQETSSHTHTPPRHRCPAAHAEDVPHRHTPAGEQLSATVVSHAAQVEPGEPHAAMVGGSTQLPPEQQPEGQATASHTHSPPAQCCPSGHCGPEPHRHSPAAEQLLERIASHAVHTDPAAPHASTVGGITQLLPEQQPAAQLVGLQPLQAPASQVCPPGQDSQEAPPLPHAAATSPV